MKSLENLTIWLLLTVGLQIAFSIVYGIYDYGAGPYTCGFIDAGHQCGILEYAWNKMTIFNLFFGIPTIISGTISFFILRHFREEQFTGRY